MNKLVIIVIVVCAFMAGIAWEAGVFLTGDRPDYKATGEATADAPADPEPQPVTEPASATQDADTADAGPPARTAIPEGPLGDLVRKGEQIFADPGQYASAYVGNDLSCGNCHLDNGRYDKTAPMRSAWPMYPAYRSKNQHVNDFAERLQGCFMYSMNGKAPPRGGEVIQALEAYSYWLAQGTRTGEELDTHGFPDIAEPEQPPSYERGETVFMDNCAFCHGADGQGQLAVDGASGFPPLWGPRSYNWGAGMHQIDKAARFIKAAMPLGKPDLTAQQAWDVALYINSQERPQDPRFNGSVQETADAFHQHNSQYGKTVNGTVLGEKSPPSGTVP